MTLSAISRYRGGTVEQVVPLARTLKAIYARYGVGYRLGRFGTDPNDGDWCVVVTYADAAAYAKADEQFPGDPDLQKVFREIARFATRVSREIVTDVAI